MKAGLIGSGIDMSLMPDLHEAEGRSLGLSYQYVRLDTGRGPHAGRPLTDLLDATESAGFAGLNITHPHKQAVVPLLHQLDGAAETLRSVNTVLFRDGQRIGCNTDYGGFRRALADRIGSMDGSEVLLVGAGGAGLAVALGLIDAGAGVCLFDTNVAAARAAAERLKRARPAARVVAFGHWPADASAFDGAVNCTPLGMEDHPGMAFDPSLLRPDAWVGDIVYFPLDTTLLRTARAQGRRLMDGGAMALHQAIEAFERITGQVPDTARMAETFETLLAARDAEEAPV